MSEPAHSESAAPPSSAGALIAALRSAGADRFDPVRFRYIEAFAGRAAVHQGSVKRALDARLAQALVEFRERFERAQSAAGEAAAAGAARYPHAARDLQRLLEAGDFKGVERLIATLASGEPVASLRALVRQLELSSPEKPDARVERNAGARPELRTVREFRNTWSKLSAGKQVSQALGQAPKNAGPINSHMLVLRSLALMREISPDYLSRFMTYADTLLSLDQGEKDKPASPKKTPAKAARK